MRQYAYDYERVHQLMDVEDGPGNALRYHANSTQVGPDYATVQSWRFWTPASEM